MKAASAPSATNPAAIRSRSATAVSGCIAPVRTPGSIAAWARKGYGNDDGALRDPSPEPNRPTCEGTIESAGITGTSINAASNSWHYQMVRLDHEDAETLRVLAKHKRCSVSELIRMFVTWGIIDLNRDDPAPR